jgi:hypothetical protein
MGDLAGPPPVEAEYGVGATRVDAAGQPGS